MKKFVLISSALLLIVGVAACAKRSVTVSTGNGAATVSQSQDQQTTTVTTKEGTLTAGKNAVDLSTLGVPVYPGAQQQEGSLSASGPEGGGQVVSLKTSDPFDKVYSYYKAQMPANSEATKTETAGSSMAMFKTGTDTNGTVVMIQGQAGTTTIMIEKFAKTK